MSRKLIASLATLVWVTGLYANPLQAEQAASPAKKTSKEKMISLAEAEPVILYGFRRYSKFYGDENTRHGGLLERSQLLGNLGGVRDTLVDHGIYIDASVTQFLQGNTSGGEDDGSARYNGSADYWLTFDSGKAGLWPGGAVFVHAESSWDANKSVNRDVGSLLPANTDAAMPSPGNSETLVLPELFMVQAFPGNILAVAGKVDWAGVADTNVFANNERTQFGYTGLVNNPILGAFAPYTSIGAAATWAPKSQAVTAFSLQSNGDARSSGFDNVNSECSAGVQYQFKPIVNGKLPGNLGPARVRYRSTPTSRSDSCLVGSVPQHCRNDPCTTN